MILLQAQESMKLGRTRFSGRGWGQELFNFQSPAVQWMARTSSLNCLSCRSPYKPLINWIASPLSLNPPFFHWKMLRRIPFPEIGSDLVHLRSRSQIAIDQRLQPIADTSIARNPAQKAVFWRPLARDGRFRVFQSLSNRPKRSHSDIDNNWCTWLCQSVLNHPPLDKRHPIARSERLQSWSYDRDRNRNFDRAIRCTKAWKAEVCRPQQQYLRNCRSWCSSCPPRVGGDLWAT